MWGWDTSTPKTVIVQGNKTTQKKRKERGKMDSNRFDLIVL
jgi:hypothetical protein